MTATKKTQSLYGLFFRIFVNFLQYNTKKSDFLWSDVRIFLVHLFRLKFFSLCDYGFDQVFISEHFISLCTTVFTV